MKKKNICLILVVFLAGIALNTMRAYAQPAMETVFQDNTYQLTGVAVSKTGRVFVNYPLWSGPHKYSVVEVMPNGSTKPYPNAGMNKWKPGMDGKNKWVCVQAVYVDDNDYLYVVDPAAPKLGTVYKGSNKVVKINLATNKVEKTYRFAGVTDNHSYLNDIRVDTKKQVAYLTNSGEGGIVVLDLTTGKSRQLLQSHKSVHSDPNFKFIVDGQELKKQGQPVKFNADGIALTADGQWLYYKPLSDKKLYRISTAALLNDQLSAQQLAGQVKELGDIATTDGMICDDRGNLYLGDIQNYRMVIVSPNLKAKTWFKSTDLIWPDSYAISNGYLYISTSQIQKQPDYNNGVNKRTAPYAVYRVKLP